METGKNGSKTIRRREDKLRKKAKRNRGGRGTFWKMERRERKHGSE